jgi:hypothetical protein
LQDRVFVATIIPSEEARRIGDLSMRAYVITTGAVFGLITLAHIWRVAVEGSALAIDPWFVLLTLASAALSFWAWRLLSR